MAIFKGAGVAIITPFNEDGSVNYDKFGEFIEEQIEGSIDAIIVCGTTGEAATLTEEEHLKVIKYCVDKVAGRVPVIAGTGSNCTRTAIFLSQQASSYGVDGLLVVTPYYNKATQDGLYDHFKAIADSTIKPIILYNVPSRTGCNILPQTLVRLCRDVKNIVGVKEASGNISQIAKIMSLGGLGVISVLANVAPKKTHEICAKFFAGDTKGACRAQLEAIDLIDSLFCEVNPIPVKTALNIMGKEVGPLRMPMSPMNEADKERLTKSLKDYGLI